MSCYAGPEISNDSLVLCLDSNNTKSYPGSGTTWFDLSPSKLNFTVNASYINSTGLLSGASASSESTALLDNDIHSIFFMIRFESNASYPNGFSGSWEKILSYNAGGSDRTPGVWRYPSQRYIHWRYDPANTGNDFGTIHSDSFTYYVNTWYYVGLTKNGSASKSYINGKKFADATVASPKTAGSAAITFWESYTLSSATLNNVHVYNRAVSDAEVLQNFNALRGRFGI
jgi:hypothetical protein